MTKQTEQEPKRYWWTQDSQTPCDALIMDGNKRIARCEINSTAPETIVTALNSQPPGDGVWVSREDAEEATKGMIFAADIAGAYSMGERVKMKRAAERIGQALQQQEGEG